MPSSTDVALKAISGTGLDWKCLGGAMYRTPSVLSISNTKTYCVAFRQMNMEGRGNGTTNLDYELPFLGRVQTNIHAQFASFTYFFIALPGLILASKVLTSLLGMASGTF